MRDHNSYNGERGAANAGTLWLKKPGQCSCSVGNVQPEIVWELIHRVPCRIRHTNHQSPSHAREGEKYRNTDWRGAQDRAPSATSLRASEDRVAILVGFKEDVADRENRVTRLARLPAATVLTLHVNVLGVHRPEATLKLLRGPRNRSDTLSTLPVSVLLGDFEPPSRLARIPSEGSQPRLHRRLRRCSPSASCGAPHPFSLNARICGNLYGNLSGS